MSEEKRVFQSRAPPNHFDISFLVIYFLIGVRCSKQNPPWGLLQAVEGAEGHRPERGRLFNLQSPLSSGSEPGQDLGSVASPPHPASPLHSNSICSHLVPKHCAWPTVSPNKWTNG